MSLHSLFFAVMQCVVLTGCASLSGDQAVKELREQVQDAKRVTVEYVTIVDGVTSDVRYEVSKNEHLKSITKELERLRETQVWNFKASAVGQAIVTLPSESNNDEASGMSFAVFPTFVLFTIDETQYKAAIPDESLFKLLRDQSLADPGSLTDERIGTHGQ